MKCYRFIVLSTLVFLAEIGSQVSLWFSFCTMYILKERKKMPYRSSPSRPYFKQYYPNPHIFKNSFV